MYRVLSICGVFSWNIPIQTAPFLALQLLWFGIWGIWKNHLKIRILHSLQPLKASHFVTQSFQSVELCRLRMSPYKAAVSCILGSLWVPLPFCTAFTAESWYFGTASFGSFLLPVYFWRVTIFVPLKELCWVVPPLSSRQQPPMTSIVHFPHSQVLHQESNCCFVYRWWEGFSWEGHPQSLLKGLKGLRIHSIILRFSRDIFITDFTMKDLSQYK